MSAAPGSNPTLKKWTRPLLGVRKKVLKQNLITAPVRQDWDNKKVRSGGLVCLVPYFFIFLKCYLGVCASLTV